MIDFYAAPTANCQRVGLTLAVLAVPHRTIPVDRAAGEQRAPAFLAINPAGAVPAILDHATGITLAQSGAILVYLAEKTGRLLPAAGPERAVAWQWLMQVLTDVNPAASLVFMAAKGIMPGTSPDSLAFLQARLGRFLGDAEAVLAQREHLAGALSIADLALYPVVVARWADAEVPARFPAIAAWARRLAAMPAIGGTVPLPG